jgi:hypothetical protein
MSDKIPFDESTWRAHIEALAESANTNCGLSYDVFVGKFSAGVDAAVLKLPIGHRQLALEVAHTFGYATAAEIEASQAGMHEMGYCSHGIEYDHCPAGCEHPRNNDVSFDAMIFDEADADPAGTMLELLEHGRQQVEQGKVASHQAVFESLDK